MNKLFPIFLKANEIDILIVGGGEIAEEKLHFLLKSSPEAKVKVVAREANDWVKSTAAQNENILLEIRDFEPSDLHQRHLVIAATNNPELNDQIRKLATDQHILLNVADKSALCDFYLGGIVTKGDLKLAISTNGQSPILAKRLRQFFEAELPDNLDEVIADLKQLRGKLNGSFERKLSALSELTKELIEQ